VKISRTVVVSLFLTLALAASAAVAAGLPEPGTPAPDFKLVTNEGKTVSLADYRGKWVALYFYPKDFTSGCTIQARAFQRDLDKYRAANAVILGVSVDSAETHKDFCTKEGLSFTLLADTDAAVSTAYGSTMEYQGTKLSARNTFLIDPNGKIARVYEKAKPAANSEEVLAAIAELSKK
jgi:thioredoxin-dependent peroxiredoxin